MKYEDFKVSDFLEDEFFMEWVRNGTKETNEFWQKWLSLHPEKTETVFKAKQIALSIKLDVDKSDAELTEEEYINLYERIVRGQKKENALTISYQERRKIRWVIKTAAAVLLLLVSGLVLWQLDPSNENDSIAESSKLEWDTSQNLRGQKSTIKLSDGTVVRLNSNSKLYYPKSFRSGDRTVKLEGEAFFDVSRDTLHPFIVETGDIHTRVLGTSFNIKTPDVEGSELMVVVETGKVSVRSKKGEVALTPNEAAIFYSETERLEKRTITDLKEIISWKEGIIYFKDASFQEVVNLLENWYDVEITLKGMPMKGQYSGEYVNESLENVLSGFCYTSGSDFSIDKKRVTIFNP